MRNLRHSLQNDLLDFCHIRTRLIVLNEYRQADPKLCQLAFYQSSDRWQRPKKSKSEWKLPADILKLNILQHNRLSLKKDIKPNHITSQEDKTHINLLVIFYKQKNRQYVDLSCFNPYTYFDPKQNQQWQRQKPYLEILRG